MEIRGFTVKYSKMKAKKTRKRRNDAKKESRKAVVGIRKESERQTNTK